MTFYELEKACKKRRMRRNIIIFSFVIGLSLLIGIVFLFSNKKVEKEPPKKEKIVKQKVEIKKVVVEKKKPEKKVIPKPQKRVEVKLQIEKEVVLKPIIDIPKNEVIKKETKSIQKPEPKKEEINKTAEKPQTDLIVTETIDYNLALKKAEEFYKNEKYEDAIKWAKRANIQDPTKPDSWILTAKALYKIGKSEKAVVVLKTYLQYYNDKKVKEVLDEINSNTIK